MESTKPSREELFILIWERPTTEVAKEFGESPRVCRRLHILRGWSLRQTRGDSMSVTYRGLSFAGDSPAPTTGEFRDLERPFLGMGMNWRHKRTLLILSDISSKP